MVWFMVFNVTFSNISVISWRSVLLVEEPGILEKTTDLSQITAKFIIECCMSTPHLSGIRTHDVSGYHTIMTTTASSILRVNINIKKFVINIIGSMWPMG